MPNRYTSRPLPSYRYRPGVTPHPIRDRNGHSYGKEPIEQTINKGDWHNCTGYLFAIDLFNDGYYWEAHEELEVLWLGSGRHTATGRFLQGIIQAAAAVLKLELAKPKSAKRLAAAATEKLREPRTVLLGVDGERLADDLEHEVAGEGDGKMKIVLEGLKCIDP